MRCWLILLAACAPARVDDRPAHPLLPDLISLDARLRDAEVSWEDGRRLLRFSAGAANRGPGPLEMQARGPDAYQVVHHSDGTKTTHHVGRFVFVGHEDHNHLHFDNFARYELRALDSDRVVASAGKVSFCLMDYVMYTDEDVDGRPPRPVFDCRKQGISPGWADVYVADLDGQSVDITDLPDGVYKLVLIIDPVGRLKESASWNNTSFVILRLEGDEVVVE